MVFRISDWKLWHDGACVFSWTAIYCFRHSLVAYFLLSIFKQKYMVTYLVLALASGTKSCIYIKGEKWVRVCFWFDSVCFPKYNNSCCFISYAIMSTLFTSTTVFLANYSSGNIKTNSIRLFQLVWHSLKWFGIFFTSGLAFFVYLNLATLLCRPYTLHFADQSVKCMCIPVYLTDAVWLVGHHALVWLMIIHTVDIMCN